MQRNLTTFLSAIILIAATLSAASANTSRLALIIGNANYQEAPLRNPINDASDMAETLKKLGFEVILKLDADQRTMLKAVHEFGQRLSDGSIGLFYYSGHGVQYESRNYLVPIKADISREFDIEFEAVDANYVLQQMDLTNNNGVNITIFDACRNNPFLRSFRNLQRGLARMDSAKGSLIAYATAPGSTAEDGAGRNGTYTKHLLATLNTLPHLSIADLFIEVTSRVEKETYGQQVPWQSLSLTHRFCLAPCGKAVKVTQPEPQITRPGPTIQLPLPAPSTQEPPQPAPSTQSPAQPAPSTQYPAKPPVPLIQFVEPDQFIRDYYAAINRREYDQTWLMLTTHFKNQFHRNRDESYKFSRYKSWWNSITRVDISWAKVRAENADSAKVRAKLRYAKKSGAVVYQKHTFDLVMDNQGRWLIDGQK